MSSQPTISQGKALMQKARELGVPVDDLLTSDGLEIAWRVLKDFKVSINGVLVEFRKDDPIRESYRIAELQNSLCPVSSMESELWRRVTMAQASKKQPVILTLKPSLWGISIDLKELTQRALERFRMWLGKRP
jgi:hypothetical protein